MNLNERCFVELYTMNFSDAINYIFSPSDYTIIAEELPANIERMRKLIKSSVFKDQSLTSFCCGKYMGNILKTTARQLGTCTTLTGIQEYLNTDELGNFPNTSIAPQCRDALIQCQARAEKILRLR